MIVVQGAELIDIIVDGGESAKNLNRPGMLLARYASGLHAILPGLRGMPAEDV
jgi:hypothetical protein